ncbi:MAG: cation diffusion facilitator family transporter [Halobacteriaceae archaeon]
MAGNSTSVVLAALFANGAIAIMKFGAWLLTGSPSMLSETYHSISDTGNQVFLLIGIRYGSREPSQAHPFGYGKAQFFYSFLVSVLLFGIAGWESAKHGYNALMTGHATGPSGAVTVAGYTFEAVFVSYAVLLGAIVFEAYALKKAYANLSAQIERRGWSGLREAFQRTSDVTVLTAFTEDTIALTGAALAMTGIFLTRYTGNYIYDAGAALLIGVMLMGFAVALAWENKRLILGESIAASEEARLHDIVAGHDGVVHVDEFRTVFFGPEKLIVTADVSFDAGLTTGRLDETIGEIEAALRSADDRVEKVYIEPEL